MADPDLNEQPLEINEGFVGEWSAILFVGARGKNKATRLSLLKGFFFLS